MKQITVYRTYSYGGTEGRDREVKTFETEALAREDAKADNWNDGFTLYKVVITFNGIITEKETRIGEIICGRDYNTIICQKEIITNALAEIEIHKANKKIKETTRNKRIADTMKVIKWAENTIKRIENKM